MLKALYQAYYQLRTLYDPSVEGNPYDRKEHDLREKARTGYRYNMPKLTKQLIVR